MSTSMAAAAPDLGFLLNGNWHTEGERSEVRAPGTAQLVGTTRRATAAHVEGAIQGSVRAFEITRHLGGFERQRILPNISHGIERQREKLSQFVALKRANR